ncbi:hypothetical protein D3C74_484760 [compost metagenome]
MDEIVSAISQRLTEELKASSSRIYHETPKSAGTVALEEVMQQVYGRKEESKIKQAALVALADHAKTLI